MHRVFFLTLMLLSVGAISGSAQPFQDGFSLYLSPYQDGHGRFLPAFPAEPIQNDAFISAEGRFIVKGQPIRFFGTNLTAGACFPEKERAPGIAARLRTFGFNLVRFHFLDNNWGPLSLFEQGEDTRHLNPEMLDRLDYFLAQLRANGIYANINLHVGRTVTAADGITDAEEFPTFGKGLFLFDPELIALQKEYAQQLLDHVSPYTGVALKDDPVMAMLEITNENSLFFFWGNDDLRAGAEGGVLPERHAALLDVRWNAYLRERYGSTEALRAAWEGGTEGGANQVEGAKFEGPSPSPRWQLEQHQGARAAWTRTAEGAYEGTLGAQVTVSQASNEGWHVQFKHTALSVEEDSVYAVTFAARADAPREAFVTMQRDVDPWTYYDGFSMALTTGWQTFSYTFVPPETADGVVRLSFNLGTEAGTYWFDDVYFGRAPLSGLAGDERLEDGTVRRTSISETRSATDARMRDMTSFYLDLEEAYYDEMRTYLKDTLGVRVPVAGTNWYPGLPEMAVQHAGDYVDNHAYWDHPFFPGEPWSRTNWLIQNEPMVQSGGGTIVGLMAGAQAAGKPYTVSEYNHPFPNRYAVEAPLFLTAYGAFHGVDGLMFYLYNQYGGAGGAFEWEADVVNDYFKWHRNPALMALVPSHAYAFREGLIAEGADALRLRFAPETVARWPSTSAASQLFTGTRDYVPQALALERRIVTETYEAEDGNETDFEALPSPSPPYVTSTGETTWDPEGLLKVITPRFVGAVGFFDAYGGEDLGAATLVDGSDFGAFSWVSLTEAALGEAERSLITLSSKAQNAGMVWDGTRTIHADWGGPPTEVYPLRLALRLTLQADSVRLYALGAEGEEGPATTYAPVAPNTFDVTLDQQVTPALWFGVERVGRGTAVGAEKEAPRPAVTLGANYPNPFGTTTTLRYAVPAPGRVTLRLYDVLGRKVVTRQADAVAGDNTLRLDGRHLAAGLYIVRLEADAGTAQRTITLVR